MCKTYEKTPAPTHCDVCGRALEARKGTRGRHRERHTSCAQLASRLNQVDDLLNMIEFESLDDVARMRSKIFNLANANLRKSGVSGAKLNPGSDRDL